MPGLAVDLSNVCRDPDLDPAGPIVTLARLDPLLAAWRHQAGTDGPVVLVADASLLRVLAPDDVQLLRAWERAGRATVVPEADPVLLHRAEREGLHVLSRDAYVDLRDDFPWIEANPERFWTWELRGGWPILVPADPVAVPRRQHSIQGERKALRRLGLDPQRPGDRDLLLTRWRCPSPSCLQARFHPAQLLVLPQRGPDGSARCPACTTPLEAIGRRRSTVQLVVSEQASGDELLRVPLEEGHPVALGRGGSSEGATPAIDVTVRLGPAGDVISRRHVELLLTAARRVQVRDRSTNGTERWAEGAGRGEPVGDGATLGPADRLVLAGLVEVRLSGQRFVADDVLPPVVGDDRSGTVLG